MWYRFEKGNQFAIPRVKSYQVAFYDMDTEDGACFDECFYRPNELDKAIAYVETIEDENNRDRSRVFVNFDNGDSYELKLEKINKNRKCSHFYD